MADEQDKTILSGGSYAWEELPGKRLPVLIVLRGAQIGRRYLLNEDTLVLGRREDLAGLVVRGDPEISGQHCRIDYSAEHDSYTLTDMGSTNGTRLNGQLVDGAELRDGDKVFIGQTILKFTFHDVIEAEFHHEVDRMMNVDELTGLIVLRMFKQRFRVALERSSAAAKPLAVLMMDLDGLKKLNDTHGHHVGSATIAGVGRMLGRLIEARGLVTRFGGDEFTAYATDCDRDQGVALGESIRAALRTEQIECDGLRVQPTISIGVAAFPADGRTTEQLTRRADEALYRAKAAGRDCVLT